MDSSPRSASRALARGIGWARAAVAVSARPALLPGLRYRPAGADGACVGSVWAEPIRKKAPWGLRSYRAWALVYLPPFLPPEPFRSGAWVSTDPASFLDASVADPCCNILPARLASCLVDCFLLGIPIFRGDESIHRLTAKAAKSSIAYGHGEPA